MSASDIRQNVIDENEAVFLHNGLMSLSQPYNENNQEYV